MTAFLHHPPCSGRSSDCPSDRPSARRITVWAITALLLGLASGQPRAATLVHEASAPFGSFGGLEFQQHSGRFIGQTDRGSYEVPFVIIAPTDPSAGNATVVVEPPHFANGLIMRDLGITRPLLLGSGFRYAAVGYGEQGLAALDPTLPGLTIAGEPIIGDDPDPTFDIGILAQFIAALDSDAAATDLLGPVQHRYAVGFSQSSQVLYKLLHRPDAAGLLDFTLMTNALWKPVFAAPDLNEGLPEQFLPLEGVGKVMFVETEWDLLPGLGRGQAFRSAAGHPDYRIYEIAGVAHTPGAFIPVRTKPPLNPLSPAAVGRAAFVAGDAWTRSDIDPPPTRLLETSQAVDPVYGFPTGIARDADLNALGGVRLPDVAIGRARYVASAFLSGAPIPEAISLFAGVVIDLQCRPEPDAVGNGPRFDNHGDYVSRFVAQTGYLAAQGFLLPPDVEAMIQQAAQSDVGKPGNCGPLSRRPGHRARIPSHAGIQPGRSFDGAPES